MAKFDLATNENMKKWIFNLAIMLRRASAANSKAIAALEKLNQESNKRDIDTSEIYAATNLVQQTTATMQYVQGTMNALLAANDRLAVPVKQENRVVGPDTPNMNSRVALDKQVDLFYKLTKL